MGLVQSWQLKEIGEVIRMFYLEQLVMSEFFQTKNLSLSARELVCMAH